MDDFQYELAGVTLGDGTEYNVERVDGLGMPDRKLADTDRVAADGASLSRDYLAKRVITLTVDFSALTAAALRELLDDLVAAWSPKDAEEAFTFKHPDRVEMLLTGRPRRCYYDVEQLFANNFVEGVILQFDAGDPVIYSSAEDSEVGAITAGNSTDDTVVTNAGQYPALPVIEITGPATNPRIGNAQDSNRQIKIDIALGAPDVLRIDLAAKTVRLNPAGANTDRYDAVRVDNQWWELAPGANTLTYSRAGTTGESPIEVTWRDAWVAV